MDATEPNPSESSPPRSGVEMVSDTLREAAELLTDVGTVEYVNPPTAEAMQECARELRNLHDVVPRADAEALAHAVSASLGTDVRELAQARLSKALTEYLAKHPWSDL